MTSSAIDILIVVYIVYYRQQASGSYSAKVLPMQSVRARVMNNSRRLWNLFYSKAISECDFLLIVCNLLVSSVPQNCHMLDGTLYTRDLSIIIMMTIPRFRWDRCKAHTEWTVTIQVNPSSSHTVHSTLYQLKCLTFQPKQPPWPISLCSAGETGCQ